MHASSPITVASARLVTVDDAGANSRPLLVWAFADEKGDLVIQGPS